VRALDAVSARPGDADAVAQLAACAYPLVAGIRRSVAERVVASDGPFARLARRGLAADDPRRARAVRELADLGRLAALETPDAAPRADAAPDPADPATPGAARELISRLIAHDDWSSLADDLADFHHRHGTGALAVHRVAHYADGRLVGVADPDPVTVDDLVGDDATRRPLADSLAAFVAGAPAVDALLYGPPGTGKSTVVRALAARHPDLRLIQLDRRALGALGDLFTRLAGEGPRCLVLLDDLVFDEGERTDRELRAVLEGDVAGRPANVCVWATSNRMRLLHETRTDREDDIEEHLGRGERSALATRFGLRVAFGTLGVDEFVAMARTLVHRRIGTIPHDVDARARRFAVDRGLSPRSARQFADLVAGEEWHRRTTA